MTQCMSIIKINKGGVLSLVLGRIKRNIYIRNYLKLMRVLFISQQQRGLIYLVCHLLKENKDEEEEIK